MALVFLVFPAVIYAALCLLPPGRQAAVGIGVAALATAGWWWLAPAGEAGDDRRILTAIAGTAIGLAALAQGLRAGLGPVRPGWVWPLVAIAVPAVALVVFLWLLGVR